MRWILAASLLLSAGLSGCASAPTADVAKRKPFAAYTKDPFVPINLFVNSDEHVSSQHALLLEYLATQLRDSGAFLRVDRGVTRWMYTLQVRYRAEAEATFSGNALRVICVMTLGLVPVEITQTHHLTVEIFQEPNPIGQLDYTETVKDRISLYDLDDPDAGERVAVDRLVERTMAGIAAKKLLPHAREIEPPPSQSPPGQRKKLKEEPPV